MVTLFNTPLTRDRYQAIIDLACSGSIRTDMGITTEAMDAAVNAILVAAPNPPQHLIDAAWDAFNQR